MSEFSSNSNAYSKKASNQSKIKKKIKDTTSKIFGGFKKSKTDLDVANFEKTDESNGSNKKNITELKLNRKTKLKKKNKNEIEFTSDDNEIKDGVSKTTQSSKSIRSGGVIYSETEITESSDNIELKPRSYSVDMQRNNYDDSVESKDSTTNEIETVAMPKNVNMKKVVNDGSGEDEEDLDSIDLNEVSSTKLPTINTNLQVHHNASPPKSSGGLLECLLPLNTNEIEKPWDTSDQVNKKNTKITTLRAPSSSELKLFNGNINDLQTLDSPPKNITEIEMSEVTDFVKMGEDVLLNGQWVLHEFSACRERYRDVFLKSNVNRLGTVTQNNSRVPKLLYAIMGAIGFGRKTTTTELNSILNTTKYNNSNGNSKTANKIQQSETRYDLGFFSYYISIILRELTHSDNQGILFDVLLNYCKEAEIDVDNIEGFFDMITAPSYYRDDVRKNLVSNKITNPKVLCDVLQKFAQAIPYSANFILQKCLENQNLKLFDKLQTEYKQYFGLSDLKILEYPILESGDDELINKLKLEWSKNSSKLPDDYITSEHISSIAYGGGPLSEFKILLDSFLENERISSSSNKLKTIEDDLQKDLVKICRSIAAGGDCDIINYFIKNILKQKSIIFTIIGPDNNKKKHDMNNSCIIIFLGQLVLYRRDRYCKLFFEQFTDLDRGALKSVIDVIEKLLQDKNSNKLPVTREDRQILRIRGVPNYLSWKDGRRREMENTLKILQNYYVTKKLSAKSSYTPSVIVLNNISKHIKENKKQKTSTTISNSKNKKKKSKSSDKDVSK